MKTNYILLLIIVLGVILITLLYVRLIHIPVKSFYQPIIKEKTDFTQDEIEFILDEYDIKLSDNEYIHSARFTSSRETGITIWIYNISNNYNFIKTNLSDYNLSDYLYSAYNIEGEEFEAYRYYKTDELFSDWNLYEDNGYWVAVRFEHQVRNEMQEWCMKW